MSLPTPYYDRDGITLYCGDCREIVPHVQADVMLTDPPYGSNYRSGRESPWRGQPIKNDVGTAVRDAALDVWGKRPALVFGEWRNPVFSARQALVWDKGEERGMGDLRIPWKPNWEMIFLLGDGFVGSRTTGVLRYGLMTHVSQGRMHPNEKPTALISELMRKCPPGIVLDPFAGSGTTLLVARDMGRKAIGIEIEEKYCALTVKRLAQGVLFT